MLFGPPHFNADDVWTTCTAYAASHVCDPAETPVTTNDDSSVFRVDVADAPAPLIGACRAMTVDPSSTPNRSIGDVAFPATGTRIRTKTFPDAGAVNVNRRFVVSNAVSANSDDVAAVAAVEGS